MLLTTITLETDDRSFTLVARAGAVLTHADTL